jgi:WXG100 family type VII secretion target
VPTMPMAGDGSSVTDLGAMNCAEQFRFTKGQIQAIHDDIQSNVGSLNWDGGVRDQYNSTINQWCAEVQKINVELDKMANVMGDTANVVKKVDSQNLDTSQFMTL